MKRSMTIMFVSHRGGKTLSVSVSLFTMFFTLFVLAGLVSVLVLSLSNYQEKKAEMSQVLEILARRRELRDQINFSRSRLKEIGEKLKRLRKMEVELSYLTDIDPRRDENTFSAGIGGNRREDLSFDSGGYVGNTPLKLFGDLMQMQEEIALFKNSSKKLEGYYEKRISILASTPSIQPLNGRIVSGIGYRRNPFGGSQKEFHEGVDITVSVGTPIRATADGVVKFVGWKGNYGKLVVIGHKHGHETRYAHCSRIKVKLLQKVKRGDIIAYSGNTGRSTGPHLHYEVRLGKKIKDPELYFLDH